MGLTPFLQKEKQMRTPAQRRNLLILRDEILPGIEEEELRMACYFNECETPSCLLGHAQVSQRFPKLRRFNHGIIGQFNTFGLDSHESDHIFSPDLPNDPSWLAANITDLLCAEE